VATYTVLAGLETSGTIKLRRQHTPSRHDTSAGYLLGLACLIFRDSLGDQPHQQRIRTRIGEERISPRVRLYRLHQQVRQVSLLLWRLLRGEGDGAPQLIDHIRVSVSGCWRAWV